MVMKFVLFALYITYCTALDNPENEETVLQRDLEDFMRRLTQRQPLRTTRPFHSAFLSPEAPDPPPSPRGQKETFEETSRFSTLRFPFGSSETRGSEPDKSPFDEYPEVSADALALASVKDVNEEEDLAKNMDDLFRESEAGRSSSLSSFGTTEDSSDNSGPYSLMHRQLDTVIRKEDDYFGDVYFVAIVAGCCAVGIFGVISAGVCFYRLQKSRKAAADVDYPAYGVTGPSKDITSPNGDRKLAQSAQMYHYQHQKQQMIAVEKAGSTKNTSASDVDSEEENEEGDYTVYECPGLAPTGDMEVKNPLFHDDSTPISPPVPPSKPDPGN